MSNTFTAAPRYKDVFWNYQRGRANAADLDKAIGENRESTGYLLPAESSKKFQTEAAKQNVFRTIATVLFTESFEKRIRIISPGGNAGFISENEAIPVNSANVMSYEIQAHKIAKIVKVSNETFSDAGFDLEGALAADFGRDFGKVEESSCVNGDGINRPYGVLHPSDGAETGVTANTLDFDSVKALYFSLAPEYRREAVWLMSDETALGLRRLKDSGGGLIWVDSDNTIFNRPVYTSPYMPAAAAENKPVLFGDFSYYWLFERGGVTLEMLREKYAAQGVTGYIGREFLDGRLIRREAIKALEMLMA